MAEEVNRTVYVGNLDERVTDRVLYDILIQAGRLVDLYIPKDRETEKPKGYAFAQYETEEIAEYAVKLFSGLVVLFNKTLKFAISGKDKPSVNFPSANSPSLSLSSLKPRAPLASYDDIKVPTRISASCRFSDHQVNNEQVHFSPGFSVNQHNGYRSRYDNNCNDYGRRVYGPALDSITQPRSRSSQYHSSRYHPYN